MFSKFKARFCASLVTLVLVVAPFGANAFVGNYLNVGDGTVAQPWAGPAGGLEDNAFSGKPSAIDPNSKSPTIDPHPSTGSSVTLQNPLKSKTLEQFLVAVIDIMLIFAIPIVVLFIMYAGFLMVTARGNEEQLKNGKRALAYALVGALLIFGAKALLSIIANTVNQFK